MSDVTVTAHWKLDKVLQKIIRAYLKLTFLIPEHLPEENNENHQGLENVWNYSLFCVVV